MWNITVFCFVLLTKILETFQSSVKYLFTVLTKDIFIIIIVTMFQIESYKRNWEPFSILNVYSECNQSVYSYCRCIFSAVLHKTETFNSKRTCFLSEIWDGWSLNVSSRCLRPYARTPARIDSTRGTPVCSVTPLNCAHLGVKYSFLGNFCNTGLIHIYLIIRYYFFVFKNIVQGSFDTGTKTKTTKNIQFCWYFGHGLMASIE